MSQQSPDAHRELGAAIREISSDPEALYDLGVALEQEDRLDEAVTYLERTRRQDPEFWGSWFHLGKITLRTHHADEAISLLRRAAELNPNGASICYELGRALNAAGMKEEAAEAMARVRQLQAAELNRDAEALRKR